MTIYYPKHPKCVCSDPKPDLCPGNWKDVTPAWNMGAKTWECQICGRTVNGYSSAPETCMGFKVCRRCGKLV